MSLLSGNIRSMRKFAGVPWKGALNDSGIVDKFLWWAPKTQAFLKRVRNGRSVSSNINGTNRKRVCNFVLVINSNRGPVLLRFWHTATYWPFQRYYRFSAENSDPTPISPKFWGCSLWIRLPILGIRGAKTLRHLANNPGNYSNPTYYDHGTSTRLFFRKL